MCHCDNDIYYVFFLQSMCTSRIRGKTQIKTANLGKQMRQKHISMEHTTLEMTTTDRPGLLSEISAVLAELRCHVSAAVAWTHNTRAACIIHVEDDLNHGSIMDPQRVDRVQAQLATVVNAHHTNSGRPRVRLTSPATGQTHAERRLHQLMMADKDYEESTYDSGRIKVCSFYLLYLTCKGIVVVDMMSSVLSLVAQINVTDPVNILKVKFLLIIDALCFILDPWALPYNFIDAK